jgi:hypothetical protein
MVNQFIAKFSKAGIIMDADGILLKSMGDIPLKLKDINKNISSSHRIDGLLNLNDIMVSHGFSIYIQFIKEGP